MLWLLWIWITIEKTTKLLAVSMKVEHYLHLLTAIDLSYVVLNAGNLRKYRASIS